MRRIARGAGLFVFQFFFTNERGKEEGERGGEMEKQNEEEEERTE